MTSQRAILLFSFVVLVLLVLGCGGLRKGRSLEARIDTLEAELASRPAMGDMIVVGKEWDTANSTWQFCVRYHAFGSIERTCHQEYTASSIACEKAVTVGRLLPDVCR